MYVYMYIQMYWWARRSQLTPCFRIYVFFLGVYLFALIHRFFKSRRLAGLLWRFLRACTRSANNNYF